MTTEEKFNAAVNVIRSLPKNGSYQPSHELMLRFYAYFKQATIGPCTGKRPAFYNVVERAKYDAWKSLGDMSQSTAMAKYVEELHTIVETMSYSDKVANFLEAPTKDVECVNMILDDLEIVAGDVLEKIRSQPNSPLASREASPTRLSSGTMSSISTPSLVQDESDHSDDEYIDTIEYPDTKRMANGLSYSEQNGFIPIEHVSRTRTKSNNVDISSEVSKAVQSLKTDIDKLTNKIHSLEHSTGRNNKGVFGSMSIQFIAFIITWPFIATFIMNKYLYKRK